MSGNWNNKILLKRQALEEALETVRYQIAHLQKFYSREQVRCWRKHRDMLIKKLAELPTPEQVAENSRRNTALVKSIIHRK